MKKRTAAKNRAKNLSLTNLKRHNAEQLWQIGRQVIARENEIMALVTADQKLARRFDILVSIPGVSAITAFSLLFGMPELKSRVVDQARLHPQRPGLCPPDALHARPSSRCASTST